MSSLINPYAHKTEETGPKIRLLACGKCKTIDVLDPYNGPRELAAEYDVVLNLAVERHQDGVERIPHAPALLVDVVKSSWDDPTAQEQIRKQLAAKFDPDAETGLGAEAYAVRDNFKDDAFACWERHLRTENCPDYKTAAKQLVPNTQAERRDLGIPKFDKADPRTQRFLCEYCPVHSVVQQRQKKAMGFYAK